MMSFYEQVARGSLALFSDGVAWVDINKVFFLDPKFRRESHIGEASFKVFQMLYGKSNVIIDLPSEVFKSFEKCGRENEISKRCYSKDLFFRNCFFKNISRLPASLRDILTLHALDDSSRNFHPLIKQHACIPVSPSGETLKCPSQLVNPGREAALLFSPCDGRFPFGNEESYLNLQRLAKLEQLGMVSDNLPWSDIVERAESIQTLNAVDRNAALKRVKALLAFINTKLKVEQRDPVSPAHRRRLIEAKFLPVLNKPDNFPLSWRGGGTQLQVLLAPKEVFLEEEKYRVCCTQPLVGVSIPRKVKEHLGLDKKHATLDHVMQQLQQATSVNVEALNAAEYEELSRVCLAAYKYMEQATENYGVKCKTYLRGMSFILVGRRFLSAQHVAFKLTADCSPFLYELPHHVANGFPKLMKVAGVKQMFDEKDYISSLQEVKKQFGETDLDENHLQVAIRLAVRLGQTLQASEVHPSEVRERWGTVYLPDSEGVMRPLPDLCFKSCPWMPDDASVRYVNSEIPWATCSQVGVKTRREEELNRHAVGIPYGQKEKLTNRLNRILTGYPCEKEILKELLQNADDAQATEICFVKDPRQHPQEKVFEDSWKQLQGPALCVYNNKPFTKADIDGIQNLGEGSKGEDPNKTGQYGVGFNAVYHLTDAPSFISKGDEIGDVLCVFDPNCKYAPGASPQEPGRKFIVSPTLQRDFPDVFPCYLGKHFPRDNATMFRFPLRTEEMARESKISSGSVSLEKLDEMMAELKKELFEVLLFVNNVKKIKLCEVDRTGKKLVNVYTVEATLSKEDDAKRQEFTAYVKKIGQMANERSELLASQVPVKKVSLVLNITDSLGNREKWLIVQQIGFEKSVKKSIHDAFKAHQLGMLPRGGVACLLEKRNSRDLAQRRKRVYCFLPLPFKTNLPVHINGHFALEHEARRNLWRDEAGHGGYRSDWNNALLQDVVASCYVRLLDEVRTFLKLPLTAGETADTESEIFQKINVYETIFPLQPVTDEYWKTLVDSVFQELNRKELQILPVVRTRTVDVTKTTQKVATVVGVTWFPPTGRGRHQAFFNNLAEKGPFSTSPLEGTDDNRKKLRKRLEAILLESGFNLVAFSLAVYESFQRSDVAACCVSPSSVVDFYRTFKSQDPLCTIGPVPCKVNNTVFESAFGVTVVLLYCRRAEHFLDKLPDLPLLLTQDNHLQLFSSRQPKIFSRYHDLLPCSPHIFLHKFVDRNIFSDVSTLTSSVLKPLDAHVFAANLPQTLSRKSYGQAMFVKWAPDHDVIPNQQWIFKLWDFFHDLVRDVLSDANLDEGCKVIQIKAILAPLFNWSILPITKVRNGQEKNTHLRSSWRSAPISEHLLAPLKHAAFVLDFKNPDSASLKLVDVLRKLGLPELNCAVLSTSSPCTSVYSWSNPNLTLARMVVSSLKDPSSLLTSLDHWISSEAKSVTEGLQQSDCRTILEYFSRSTGCLQDTDRSTLRKLPFYLAIHGGFVSLDDAKVCVLPTGIPRKEIDVLERELSVVFVESGQSLSGLFDFLALECVSAVDVYCTFILKKFSILSVDARKSHLEYIHKSILTDFVTEDCEQQRMLDCLRNTPLLHTEYGTLQTASHFYDPGIEVFRSMLSDNDFPSEPFDSSHWITFLRKIGLVHEVSLDHFRRFATELAIEAATARTNSTYDKSEVLIRHLICRHDVVREGWLQAVRDIAFVAPHHVKQPLQVLCPPFSRPEEEVVVEEDDVVIMLEEEEEKRNELPFISFKGAVLSEHEDIAWTKAYLLPNWADPRSRLYDLNCPPGCSIDQYCKTFLAQLQVVTKPTVDLVARHCKAVCLHLESTRPLEIVSPVHYSTVMMVMEHIYRFLQDNAMKRNEAKSLLKAIPCILVEQGRKFIMPSQAVLELYEDYEIKPLLYRVPPEFGKFQRLFEYLGCSKSVKPTHYAMVLEMLHDNCQNTNLQPDQVSMCSKAVKGLFESLQEDTQDLAFPSILYLPAMPSGRRCLDRSLNEVPVTLYKSTYLVFDDTPTFGHRFLSLNLRFVLDLSMMDVRFKSVMTNYKELMMRLPASVQPVMLSSIVKEKLTYGKEVTSGAVNALMHRLTRPPFVHGIARIMRDVNSHWKDFDENVIANIEKSLQSIDLCAVESLRTALFYNDQLIPGSKREVPSFKEKSEVDGQEEYRVYINVGQGIDDDLAKFLIANVIADIYGDLLGKNAWLIPEMLRCPLSNIWSLLDKTGIRQDDRYKIAEMDISLEPGTYIPIDEHHLLNEAFVEFTPGDFVGYQLHDPSLQLEEGVATYIYAEIIKELDVIDLDFIYLTKMYLINIGNDKEPIEVSSAFLYKLHRIQEISQQAIEVPRHSNREEVFDEISKILEDAWTIPEDRSEQRRQIMKRLVLRWHPEKNLEEDKEFCVRAFEYIKNEVFRLGGSSYGKYIDAWVTCAREQGSQRDEYIERLVQEYGPLESSSNRSLWHNIAPSFCQRNPQPGEARRWFKQAEADLAAVANDIDCSRPSYEWACFKCHQVKITCCPRKDHDFPGSDIVLVACYKITLRPRTVNDLSFTQHNRVFIISSCHSVMSSFVALVFPCLNFHQSSLLVTSAPSLLQYFTIICFPTGSREGTKGGSIHY